MSPGGGFRMEEVGGVVLLRHAALESIPGLSHAFSTRRCDGAGDFDLGGAEEPVAPAVTRRRSRFLAAAGFERVAATVLRQVHGTTIVRAREVGPPVEADGAFWLKEDGALGLPTARSADCVPILLACVDGRAAAAVHAGWRGTAAGIAGRAVAALGPCGVEPRDLVAVLGPSIGPCCYPVGADVFRTVLDSVPAPFRAETAGREGGEGFRLDLQRAVQAQLRFAGVLPGRVHRFPGCSACRGDLFFSYRRDGAGSGRMMAAVGASRADSRRA